jgi:hypothetical protein
VFSLANKLMGQVNVVRYGMKSVRPSGAMTLTTGLAAQYTSPGSAIITTVNAAVEAFVRAAAAEPSKSSALDLTPSDEGPARTCKRGSVPRRLGRDRKGEPCEQDPRHWSRRPDWRAGG